MEIKRRNKKRPIPNHGREWTPYQKRMAKNMARIMREKNINKSALSEKSGIAFGTITEYLKAQTASPSLKQVSSIAYGLGVSIKDILK